MFSFQVIEKTQIIELSEMIKCVDTKWYKPSEEFELLKSHIYKWNARFLLYQDSIVWCIITMHEPLSTQIRCIVSNQKWWGKYIINELEQECLKREDKKLRCWSRDILNAKWFYKKMWFSEQFLIEKFEFGNDCRFFGKTLG